MSWLKENRLRVLMNYLNVLFIVKVMTQCYRMQDANYIYITVMCFVGLAVFLIYNEIFERKKYNIIATFITFALIGGVVFWSRDLFLDFLNNTIVFNFTRINDALYAGSYTYFEMFKPFVMILVPPITILLLFLDYKGLNNVVLVVSLSVMTFFWYLGYTAEIRNNIIMFIMLSVATYAVNSYINNIKQLNKLGIQIILEKNKIISYIVAYSLIISWIGVFLPQQIEGKYTETGNKRWVNPFGPNVGDSPVKAKQNKYSLGSSGYNNVEKKLGGPIVLGEEIAFKVEADKVYYLKGDTREFYTGSSWRKEAEEYIKGFDVSDSELNRYIEAILGMSGNSTNKKSMMIYPEKINSSTLFVPSYPLRVNLEKGNIYYEKNGMTFANSGKVTKPYRVEFMDPDAVLNSLGWQYTSRDISFSRVSYERYLQLPEDSITERTVELVYSIVGDKKSNKEKIEAIRAYLSKEYPYSLEVSNVPEGVDFVDYFLFIEKKGYCVYFASAMTVMARLAGIPARYVEGFKMPNSTIDGFYHVTGEQAHAWTEVLLQQNPEIWVTIDCSTTPAEARERRQQEQGSGDDNVDEPVPGANPGTTPETKPEPVENTPGIDNIGSELSRRSKVIGCVILILAAAVLACLLRLDIRKKRMLNTKSFIPIYSYLLKRFKHIGIKKSDLSTDMEFARDIYDSELRGKVIELVEKVYSEFYGNTIDDALDKADIYNFMEDYIRQRQNVLKYYFIKYFI
jgi:transglutaminase-like putative cysteine protease